MACVPGVNESVFSSLRWENCAGEEREGDTTKSLSFDQLSEGGTDALGEGGTAYSAAKCVCVPCRQESILGGMLDLASVPTSARRWLCEPRLDESSLKLLFPPTVTRDSSSLSCTVAMRMGSPDLANRNRESFVRFEFQTNNKKDLGEGISISQIVQGSHSN